MVRTEQRNLGDPDPVDETLLFRFSSFQIIGFLQLYCWPVGLAGYLVTHWVPRRVSLWAFVTHLLPRGWTGQAQTFKVSSAHMAERLPIYGFLKNSIRVGLIQSFW